MKMAEMVDKWKRALEHGPLKAPSWVDKNEAAQLLANQEMLTRNSGCAFGNRAERRKMAYGRKGNR